MMNAVSEWRTPLKKGRKIYDDKAFVESLSTQFARRHSLSPRQTIALKRVAVAYRAQIPNFDSRAEALGLKNLPSSDEKKAEVLDGVDEAES